MFSTREVTKLIQKGAVRWGHSSLSPSLYFYSLIFASQQNNSNNNNNMVITTNKKWVMFLWCQWPNGRLCPTARPKVPTLSKKPFCSFLLFSANSTVILLSLQEQQSHSCLKTNYKTRQGKWEDDSISWSTNKKMEFSTAIHCCCCCCCLVTTFSSGRHRTRIITAV